MGSQSSSGTIVQTAAFPTGVYVCISWVLFHPFSPLDGCMYVCTKPQEYDKNHEWVLVIWLQDSEADISCLC